MDNLYQIEPVGQGFRVYCHANDRTLHDNLPSREVALDLMRQANRALVIASLEEDQDK